MWGGGRKLNRQVAGKVGVKRLLLGKYENMRFERIQSGRISISICLNIDGESIGGSKYGGKKGGKK